LKVIEKSLNFSIKR